MFSILSHTPDTKIVFCSSGGDGQAFFFSFFFFFFFWGIQFS
uniref:Uncharacterized protein n=1 Tax=Rhizophora mucronata TaxID=61149 RepID=A0A2P2NJZ5_RHIMU